MTKEQAMRLLTAQAKATGTASAKVRDGFVLLFSTEKLLSLMEQSVASVDDCACVFVQDNPNAPVVRNGESN
jgi:hypothetical protein